MKISNPLRPTINSVTVEYDVVNGRKSKEFPSAWAARSFYFAKSKAGKNPKIVSAKVVRGY